MKTFWLFFMSCFLSQAAMAQSSEMAFTAGVQTTAVETDTTGVEVGDGTGFLVGILGFIEIGDGSFLRSGAVLNQRKWDFETTGTKVEVETLNIDIPVTFLFKFNDNIGAFGGLRLGVNVSDDCTSNNNTTCDADPESVYYGAEGGGHFHFAPDFGVEVAYNIGLSELADQLDWDNSLKVNAFFIF
jgi:hypothetical protein